jgi:hypothetical protein
MTEPKLLAELVQTDGLPADLQKTLRDRLPD